MLVSIKACEGSFTVRLCLLEELDEDTREHRTIFLFILMIHTVVGS